MMVEDGVGSGRRASVNEENQLDVHAVIETRESHVNRKDGEAFNAIFAVNPDGAGDVFFYIKNLDDKDLIIEGIWIQTSAAEEITIRIGDTGVAVKTSGADIVPANLNAGSNQVADVLCYGNVADGAVDITGLTAGKTIQFLYLTSATSGFINFEQDVIIPKNQTFTIIATGGDTLLRGTVVFHMHQK